ncbi:hypothetical protein D6774_02935 [Candidatus Woesearchaeota archaeon]|nr:MAG: hypothetical protein D6774_02935 [Candidatus Woesearchaeota archaeon]
MTFTLEHRYETTRKGDFVVAIALDTYEEIFNEWDNTKAYHKKDLDEEFVAYLIESFDELKGRNAVIRLDIPKRDKKKKKAIKGIHLYFDYLSALKKKELRVFFSKMVGVVIIGATFISASVIFAAQESLEENLLNSLFHEGMVIVGWVTI